MLEISWKNGNLRQLILDLAIFKHKYLLNYIILDFLVSILLIKNNT